MTVQITSIEAYKQLYIDRKIGEEQLKVLEAILSMQNQGFNGATDTEIACELGASDPVNSKKYRPRRNELVNMDLVCEVGRCECSWTGRQVIQWGITGKTKVENPFELKPTDPKQTEVADYKDVQKVEKLILKFNLFQAKQIDEFLKGRLQYLEELELGKQSADGD